MEVIAGTSDQDSISNASTPCTISLCRCIHSEKRNQVPQPQRQTFRQEQFGTQEQFGENIDITQMKTKSRLKRSFSSFFRRKSQKMSEDEHKVSKPDLANQQTNSNGNASDSSEAELLLANEEEQEVDLNFARGEANESAETSDASPQIAVQQFAKSALTTRASRDEDKVKPEGAESELIPCRRTSMLTESLGGGSKITREDSEELEMISAESLAQRAQRNRALLIGASAVVGITLAALVIRRAVSRT